MALSAMLKKVISVYDGLLKTVVLFLAGIAAMSVMAMIAVTCVDVVMRIFRNPILGSFDMIRIAGMISIACALPYTTAVKGHVAIEFLHHRLSRLGRTILDVFVHSSIMVMFVFLGIRLIDYGSALHKAGQVSATLQIPMFWIPYVISLSCFVTVLVTLHILLHPGKEMIKP
jgi:TRAP-type C4-dicarboxylate transport system permease small subunit